jgi:hypothetical protein
VEPEAEARNKSLSTTSDLLPHAYARYIRFLLDTSIEEQLQLRPTCRLLFLPLEIYKNKNLPIPGETERRLYLLLYQIAPIQKVKWIQTLHVRFILEQMTEPQQTQMLNILQDYYGKSKRS